MSSCASGGAIGVLSGSASGEANANMVYQPAPGITATSMTLWRAGSASQTMNPDVEPYTIGYYALTGAAQMPPESEQYAVIETGFTWDFRNPGVGKSVGTVVDPFAAANKVVINPLPTLNPAAPIKIMSTCSRWSGAPTCDARYMVMAYDVALRDDSTPTVGAVAGSLVDGNGKIDPAVGPLTGLKSVVVLGTDSGSGLYRTIVEVDGAEVASGAVAPPASGANRCVPSIAADGQRAFVVRQPCPLQGSATASLDTTKLSDGTHSIRVLIEDASGNRALASEGKVAVRNEPTTGPGSPEEFRGEPNGSVKTDTASISLAWPATARKPSTKKKTIRRCKKLTYVAKHPVPCQGRGAAADYTTSWSRTKLAPVAGRLIDSAGQPIANASVMVSATAQATGAATRPLATLNTDANGAFTLAVPRAEGSQVITAQWMARAGDTRPATAGTATLTVQSATGLKAKERARRGGSVTFSGTLRGKASSMGAVPVSLEVRYRGRWKTFANATTDPTGKWTVKVRKFATTPGRYKVRALTGVSPTYPFAAGAGTRTTTVKVG